MMYQKHYVTMFFLVSMFLGISLETNLFAMEEDYNNNSKTIISSSISGKENKTEEDKSVYNKTAIHGNISGFPEFLPKEQVAMQKTINLIKNSYEKFGFVPLETPSVEKISTLQAKGIVGKEVYGLRRLNVEEEGEDDGRKDLALRFDLTVPLARYIAEHYTDLTFPFRRYQIQTVWRGEKPAPGRYREFYQCDIDVIGRDTLSLHYDAELPLIVYETLKAMNIGPFVIRINNRKVLEGLFQEVGLEKSEHIKSAIKVIDNIEKVSLEETYKELGLLNIRTDNISKLSKLFKLDHSIGIDETLYMLKENFSHPLFKQGIQELEGVVKEALELGVPKENIVIDPRIARGLDYYTGTIYETKLVRYPSLGSICSGGRYENLASEYSDKKLPGVGMSIGLSRFIPQLFREGLIKADVATVAPVLVTTQDHKFMSFYYRIASLLRKEGIATEVYLEPKKLKHQLDFANKKGFKLAVIANKHEIEKEEIVIKDLLNSQQETISFNGIITYIINKLK